MKKNNLHFFFSYIFCIFAKSRVNNYYNQFNIYSMKSLLIIFLMSVCPYFCKAQNSVTFAYDAAGNRISRTIVLDRNVPQEQQRKQTSTRTDMLSKHHIAIAPNPTDGLLQVSITGLKRTDACVITVYKTSGQLVVTLPVARDNTTVDISGQPNGYYILAIDINGEKSTWKIIKK